MIPRGTGATLTPLRVSCLASSTAPPTTSLTSHQAGRYARRNVLRLSGMEITIRFRPHASKFAPLEPMETTATTDTALPSATTHNGDCEQGRSNA